MEDAPDRRPIAVTRVNFNLLDFAVVALVTFGVWRGGRRGFPAELPRFIGVSLAVVAGSGLFRLTERMLSEATETAGLSRGPVSFIAILIATFVLVRHFKQRIRVWAEAKVPEADRRRRYGMLIGGGRALGLCALAILLSSLIPIGEFRKPFTRGSAFGRMIVKTVRPVYRAAQQLDQPKPVAPRSGRLP